MISSVGFDLKNGAQNTACTHAGEVNSALVDLIKQEKKLLAALA